MALQLAQQSNGPALSDLLRQIFRIPILHIDRYALTRSQQGVANGHSLFHVTNIKIGRTIERCPSERSIRLSQLPPIFDLQYTVNELPNSSCCERPYFRPG